MLPHLSRMHLHAEKWFHVTTFITYAFACCGFVLPTSILGTIQKDMGLSTGTMSLIASRQNMGSSSGKLLASFLVDTVGAYCSLLFSFIGIACTIFYLSQAQTTWDVSLCCIAIEFFNASVYPAIQARIGTWYKIETDNPKAVDQGCQVLSLASRLGGLGVLFAYGAIIESTGWRKLCYTVSLILGAAIAWTTLFVSDSSKKKIKPGKPLTVETVKGTIMECIFNGGFWIFMLGFGFVACVRRVDSLMAIYLKDTTDLDAGTSTQMVMAHPAGYLAGLFLISPIYSKMESNQSKIAFIRMLFFVASIVAGIMAMTGQGQVYIKVGGIFALTALTTVQYYIISGAYSVSFGKNCGFMSSFSDMISYVVVSQVFGFSSGILDQYGWGAFWGLLAGLLGLSLVSYEIFLRYYFFAEEGGAGKKTA